MSGPLNLLLYGASGMVGQGVLREAVRDPEVGRIVIAGRSTAGATDPKAREILADDLADVPGLAEELPAIDACVFCLGVSAAGMSEDAYRRVTHDLTLSIARALAAARPAMRFIYVSGAGTDAKSRSMWARVKGETEDALFALPFSEVFAARPGYIQPMGGIRSKTAMYRAIYAVMGPLFPLTKAVARGYVTTTEEVGRALVDVAKHGAPMRVLENRDLVELARGRGGDPSRR